MTTDPTLSLRIVLDVSSVAQCKPGSDVTTLSGFPFIVKRYAMNPIGPSANDPFNEPYCYKVQQRGNAIVLSGPLSNFFLVGFNL